MKVLPVLAVLVVLAACGKHDDVATLHHEATILAKYYQPKLEAQDQRIQQIFKRGTTIPANLPGIERVGERLTSARDTLVRMRDIVAPGPDGKSAVEKQAEQAAKARNVADLTKLVHDTEITMERGLTIVTDDLGAVESWIAQYEQRPQVAKADGEAAPPAPEQPAAPPGQPAPAAEQPAQPAPQQPQPTPSKVGAPPAQPAPQQPTPSKVGAPPAPTPAAQPAPGAGSAAAPKR